MDAKCKRCGEDSWSPGVLVGMARVAFRPDRTKFLTLETGQVDVRARMCSVCGSIDLLGDAAKLERLNSEAKAAAEE